MDFNKQYNREDFLDFLGKFLPGDFGVEIKDGEVDKKFQKISKITELGGVKSLGTMKPLAVYEIKHQSESDPRVSLTKEAFWVMKDRHIRRALMVFYSENSKNYRFSLMTIDLKDDGKKVKQEFSNPRRYSFFLGPDSKTHTPNNFLIKRGEVKDFDDLVSRFNIEVVNKDFYKEISECFYKLAGAKIGNKEYRRILELPSVSKNDYRKYQEFVVRLIGRIIFIWFLKHKKSNINKPLIPRNLISSQAVDNFSNYYHEVLEKLFFEILNKKIKERKKEILPNADLIPFLNGGLFNPQSDDFYEDKPSYNLTIPDSWFKQFFEILELYNFTIDESTPTDIEISVDPEMLGRIFENLLAEINPNTGESARKATGSYYTPRVIVEYMVNQSLKYYLLNKTNINENKIERLLSYSEDNIELTEDEKNKIIKVLDEIKIIDPACGSGAFPMGVLQKMLLVLQKIDPQSKKWLSKQLDKIDNEVARKEVEKKLKNENWDYVHKLGIIQNSIYGVDIQPIAVEISKLRFFLSLIVDEKIEDEKENRGIDPLPNLEFKFVCANTLISSPEEKQTNGLNLEFKSDSFFVELEKMTKCFFNISNNKEKEKKKAEIKKLINEKVKEKFVQIESLGKSSFGDKYNKAVKANNNKKILENTRSMNLWKSYTNIFTTDSPVLFFESKYFFPSVKNGFDIVIGNPPYVSVKNISISDKKHFSELFETGKGRFNLFTLFLEKGHKLLKNKGILSYILPEVLYTNSEYKYIRKYLLEKTQIISVSNFSSRVFDASVDTSVIIIKNEHNLESEIKVLLDLDSLITTIKQSEIDDIILTKNSSGIKSIIDKINQRKEKLGNIIEVQQGIIYSGQKKEDVFSNQPVNKTYKKILDGRDIQRYFIKYDQKKENRYIKYTRELHRPREERLFLAEEKLIFPRRSKSFVCTIDIDKFYLLNTAYVCLLKDLKYNLKYLLAILNSKLINFYYSKTYLGWQITIPAIKLIPIPKISAVKQKPFIKLVDQILEKKKDNPKADTTDLEKKIDKMVYGLYELTKEEIKIIENNF